jgi:homospermidine synthase
MSAAQAGELGPAGGHVTDGTPLSARSPLFPGGIGESDPWQFRTVLAR